MSLFFIIFFVLYGGMHFYAFLKVRSAVALGPSAVILIIIFMLVMIFAPFIIRMSEKFGFEYSARIMSYIGYIWMGVLFLFVSSSFAVDFFRLLIHLFESSFQRDLHYLKPSPALSLFIPFVLSVSIAIYGYFEARNIRTEHITIKTSKIPQEVGRLRIVQISDVHIGLIIREERLKNILREVKKAGPDILVSTGDLVDGQINNLIGLSGIFNDINPKYGKFAITGNHEFYAGLSQAVDFTKNAGFIMLRSEGLTVNGLINIIGIDDPAGRPYGLFREISESELLSKFPRDKFTLFLKHRPLVDKTSFGLFDLQLSGHVHKGQIFPFSIITKIYYPVHAGFAEYSKDSRLYVSRGAGTWGPPIRFLSPPEVTVIDIVHENIP